MKRFRSLICWFFALISLSACKKENAFDCLKSTGKIVTKNRTLSAFESVKVYDNLDVIIIQDSVWFVEVKAGENLQSNILTKVQNNELEIRNINKCNWVRSYHKPMEIRVHMPQINTLYQLGYGTLRSEGTLKTESLFLHVLGAGDIDLNLETTRIWLDMYELGNIKLTGKNRDLTAYVGGNGTLRAEGLTNQYIGMEVMSSGDAHVKAQAFLGALIKSSGNVYYYNQPQQTDLNSTGSGQFVRVQ